MATRAEELARRFGEASDAFTAYVETVPDERWRQPASAGDPRAVGAVVYHVAWWNWFFQRHFHNPGRLITDVDATNAELAEQAATVSKRRALAGLRAAGTTVVEWVRGLGDEELERSGQVREGAPPRTVEDAIEALITHMGNHQRDMADG
jgi:uncharacterized damage-inducible protein DinB